MESAQMAYATPCDAAGALLAVSLFADRPRIRSELREDAQAAGFRLAQVEPLSALEEGGVRILGDIVMVDAPGADAKTLTSVARLGERVERAGARLVVSTTIGALDDVFAAVADAPASLLVEPSRAERLVALGEALGQSGPTRLRELTEKDRLLVMRLTERVSKLADKLDPMVERANGNGNGQASAFAFPNGHTQPSGEESAAPRLPEAQVIRSLIRTRQARARFFDEALFADPAWDILLDLAAARVEQRRVSVTSLCIASGVPPTTALRWISQMTDRGLLRRVRDDADRRRAFVTISDPAAEAMARYFASAGAHLAA